MVFNINVGILLAFIFGEYLNYTTTSVVSFGIPIAFAVLFVFFPETPSCLMQSGDIKVKRLFLGLYKIYSKSASIHRALKNPYLSIGILASQTKPICLVWKCIKFNISLTRI